MSACVCVCCVYLSVDADEVPEEKNEMRSQHYLLASEPHTYNMAESINSQRPYNNSQGVWKCFGMVFGSFEINVQSIRQCNTSHSLA